MTPRPQADDPTYRGSGKLVGKAAMISGGDSGIGRAVAIAFAREGADLAISYLDEHKDAEETAHLIAQEGRRSVLLPGDVGHTITAAIPPPRATRRVPNPLPDRTDFRNDMTP